MDLCKHFFVGKKCRFISFPLAFYQRFKHLKHKEIKAMLQNLFSFAYSTFYSTPSMLNTSVLLLALKVALSRHRHTLASTKMCTYNKPDNLNN